MGDDFAYKAANETFKFVEDFKAALEGEIEIVYSTPSRYMAAVRAERLELPVYRGDFLPLLMQYPHHYWSGYYTSRPAFKKLLRDSTYLSFLSLTQYSLRMIEKEDFRQEYQVLTNALQNAMSLAMHHDTITGTSRQYVVNKAISKLEGVMEPNSKRLALLFMQRMAEMGVKVKDFMHHLRSGYNEKLEVIDLSKANETLLHVFNPSLDYIDTTLLRVQGADFLRLYVWVPET